MEQKRGREGWNFSNIPVRNIPNRNIPDSSKNPQEAEKKDPAKIKEKIINLLRIRGPCLPVHVARETGMNSLFAGAFLSQLADEKLVRISDMKVGGSPLYYLPGHEINLENFCKYLPGKEKEAFFMLKEKKLLQDSELEPAIRVALRSIKDFAFPIAVNAREGKVLFWRFLSFSEEEAKKIIEDLFEKRREEEKEIEVKKKAEEIKAMPKEFDIEKLKQEILEKVREEKKVEDKKARKEKLLLEKPLIQVKEVEKEKKQISSKFFEEVKEFLAKKDIEFLQEIFVDKKEVMAKVRINSDLGKITFFLIAKDKKRITEADLITAYQKALNEKQPCYFLSKAEISKKMTEFLKEYSNLLKAERM